jgi:hypothetical protein
VTNVDFLSKGIAMGCANSILIKVKTSFLKREKAAGILPRGAGPEEQTQYSINQKKRPEFKRKKLRKSIDRRGRIW